MRRTLTLAAVVLALAMWAVAQAPNTITVVAGPIPQNVTDNSATMWWETSAPTSSIFKYGTDQNNLTQTAQAPYGAQSHHVQLTGLQPNTTYFYQVQRTDGSVMISGEFHTQASGYQQNQAVRITNGPNIEYLGPDSAVIAWTTNIPSSAVVHYGTGPNATTQTAQAPWGGTTHRVTVNGLHPGGTYYFVVESGQGQGNGSGTKSDPAMFYTPGDAQHAMHPMQGH